MATQRAKYYLKVAKLYCNSLRKNFSFEKAIIFGSLARGEINEDSDIDLIILSSDFKKWIF